MRNWDEDDKPARRRGVGNFAVLGVAAILGIAAVSAYVISGKDAPVKPASGSANAMALASSKPAPR
ncbi:hypothetical protein U5A82_05415 [Sphingobium sp. CR2-8]|uniref:hypothetical protein n=1 Tax=Sphingobium sp. CR2-8 TaxID=1306534 RepID=UPI002DB7BFD3|nr:hypothetical protein [Sphingobium sp. CR2-8]MEC3909929.1 hypothetical protein [Sphingobium sp. CR2-8]